MVCHVFVEIISYVTEIASRTGLYGAEFGKADKVFVRQNKMVYAEEPTGEKPPMREWIFTRLDTGVKVGVKFNPAVITPIATPEQKEMGRKWLLVKPHRRKRKRITSTGTTEQSLFSTMQIRCHSDGL